MSILDIPSPPSQRAGEAEFPGYAFRSLAMVWLTILAFGALIQTRWGVIPDTSWLVYVAERILAGDRLYADLYETNPPFSIWLYLPLVAIAGALDLSSEMMVHLWTYAAAAAGLALAGIIVRKAEFGEARWLVALSPLFLALLVLFPGNAFSEREHIGLALMLPMLALQAWRAKDTGGAPGFALAALAGLCGSILILVKPHYATVVALPAFFVAWRRRNILALFATEYWVIGLVATSYLAAVLIFYPEFFRDLFPILADTYLRMGSYLSTLFPYGLIYAVLMVLMWRVWPRQNCPEPATVALLASIGGAIPLVIQAKGWPYHAYPALVLALVSFLCLVARHRALAGDWFPAAMARPAQRVIFALAVAAAYAPFWSSQKPEARIVEAVRSSVAAPTVALIGSDMAEGHPLTRMVGGTWASAYNSDWLGAFALYLKLLARHAGEFEQARHYEALLKTYVEFKRNEFLKTPPDILVIQQHEELWTETLLGEHGFQAILDDYRLLAEDRDSLIFLHSSHALPDTATR